MLTRLQRNSTSFWTTALEVNSFSTYLTLVVSNRTLLSSMQQTSCLLLMNCTKTASSTETWNLRTFWSGEMGTPNSLILDWVSRLSKARMDALTLSVELLSTSHLRLFSKRTITIPVIGGLMVVSCTRCWLVCHLTTRNPEKKLSKASCSKNLSSTLFTTRSFVTSWQDCWRKTLSKDLELMELVNWWATLSSKESTGRNSRREKSIRLTSPSWRTRWTSSISTPRSLRSLLTHLWIADCRQKVMAWFEKVTRTISMAFLSLPTRWLQQPDTVIKYNHN